MTDTPLPDIIVVRTCPEHRVRLFERERFWERYLAGELRADQRASIKKQPQSDYLGRKLIANVNLYLRDDKFPPNHQRHIVLHTHCHITEDGDIGASGKIDPKEMLVGEFEFRQLANDNPCCDLCVNGDMIPMSGRFYSSTYRPAS